MGDQQSPDFISFHPGYARSKMRFAPSPSLPPPFVSSPSLLPVRPERSREAPKSRDERSKQGLVLGCRGDPLFRRQVRQKRLDLRAIHLLRVALSVEVDDALDSADVRLFRAQAVLFVAQPVPDAIQQLGLCGHDLRRGV